jgi:phage-related minor tail protein
MSTDLEQVQHALAEYDRVAAGIAELTRQYGSVVFDVTTTTGMDGAKAARAAIREPRYEIERVRKAAKAPLLSLGKKIDSEAARITGELMKLEDPIHAQIAAEEKRKEDERAAKVQAELDRVNGIQARIARIREWVTRVANDPAEKIATLIGNLEEHPVDDSFAEFRQAAEDAKGATLAKLREMLAAALQREAEQKRVADERMELARLRIEQEKRDAAARAEREEADRQAAAARAEEDRRRRAEQDALDAELRARQAEQDRVERERQAAADAQAQRLAAERAELERREAAVREAEKPKPAAKGGHGVKRPTDLQIVQAVAEAFGVGIPTATKWLSEMRLAA